MTVQDPKVTLLAHFDDCIAAGGDLFAVFGATTAGCAVGGSSVALLSLFDNSVATDAHWGFRALVGTAGSWFTVLRTKITFFAGFHDAVAADAHGLFLAFVGTA